MAKTPLAAPTHVASLALLLTTAVLAAPIARAIQEPAPPAGTGRGRQGGPAQPGRGRGPNYPQQQRPLADAAVIARGKGLYESNCAACHGIDLRGGQQGGPNLLRSQLVLSDKNGELIMPVIQSGRPTPAAGAPPMPPFALPPDDLKAIAEYLHSVLARAGAQGRPPAGDVVPPEKILVGDAAAGQTYFTTACSRCHAVDGDLKGIAARVADPRELQNLWVSGGGGGRGGRGAAAATERPVTAVVTSAAGAPVEGRLLRIDDFIVVLMQGDGSRRTFVRKGDDPKIELRDPADAHRALVSALTDRDMHNVTAYLWTMK